MRQLLHDAKEHWLASVAFLVLWAGAYALHVGRWLAPSNTGDIVPPVLLLHLFLPVIAGVLAAWWHGPYAGRVAGGMMAGAAVLGIDGLLLGAHDAAVYGGGEAGGAFEAGGLLILFGIGGAILGAIGGAGAALFSGSAVEAAAAPVRASLLRVVAGLAFAAGALVLLAVIPPVRSDIYPGANPEGPQSHSASTRR